MPKGLFPVIILLILVLGFFLIKSNQTESMPTTSQTTIKYISIGDSYTIGNGVGPSGRWPNVLVKNLNQKNIMINLIANPAVSGYTVTDAIRLELPQVEKLKPDFVTVLIGANDNFSQTPVSVYQQDLTELLDRLQAMLTNPKNIVLITIPDYTKSPAGLPYQSKNLSQSIEQYNKVINDEAIKRDLKVADIFPVSQAMTGAEDYISDGLHPSAQGYAKWEKVILPVVLDLLNNT